MALSGFSPSTPFPRPTDDGDPDGQSDDGQGGQPEDDSLEEMTKAELAKLAGELGLSKQGNKGDLVERIRAHRAEQAPADDDGEADAEGGETEPLLGVVGPTPEQDADQTGADANPAPDHDGVTDPDARDDPYSDETATVGD